MRLSVLPSFDLFSYGQQDVVLQRKGVTVMAARLPLASQAGGIAHSVVVGHRNGNLLLLRRR